MEHCSSFPFMKTVIPRCQEHITQRGAATNSHTLTALIALFLQSQEKTLVLSTVNNTQDCILFLRSSKTREHLCPCLTFRL